MQGHHLSHIKKLLDIYFLKPINMRFSFKNLIARIFNVKTIHDILF
jgi:hypothetical protein